AVREFRFVVLSILLASPAPITRRASSLAVQPVLDLFAAIADGFDSGFDFTLAGAGLAGRLAHLMILPARDLRAILVASTGGSGIGHCILLKFALCIFLNATGVPRFNLLRW